MRKVYDWQAIQRYHNEGHGFVDCQRRFGFGHTAWVKALKRGELRSGQRQFADRRRRYDWSVIQAYYDEGHSYRQCKAKFGFNPMAWHKARVRGEITTRPLGMPLSQLLMRGKSRRNVKARLLRAGLLENRCLQCGLSEWRGKPITLHIDHINGVRDDHRLENLRILCPNCHSQTDTYGGHNVKRRRFRGLQDPGEVM